MAPKLLQKDWVGELDLIFVPALEATKTLFVTSELMQICDGNIAIQSIAIQNSAIRMTS